MAAESINFAILDEILKTYSVEKLDLSDYGQIDKSNIDAFIEATDKALGKQHTLVRYYYDFALPLLHKASNDSHHVYHDQLAAIQALGVDPNGNDHLALLLTHAKDEMTYNRARMEKYEEGGCTLFQVYTYNKKRAETLRAMRGGYLTVEDWKHQVAAKKQKLDTKEQE